MEPGNPIWRHSIAVVDVKKLKLFSIINFQFSGMDFLKLLLHLPTLDPTLLKDAGIEPRTFATCALAFSRF
jgi:hypothetical protein